MQSEMLIAAVLWFALARVIKRSERAIAIAWNEHRKAGWSIALDHCRNSFSFSEQPEQARAPSNLAAWARIDPCANFAGERTKPPDR